MDRQPYLYKIDDKKFDVYKEEIRKKNIYLLIKRFIDILLSLLLIVVLLIPMLIIFILIYLEDRNTPIFLQDRVTKNGRIFKIIKFRSMKVSNSTLYLTVNNDSRITKVGKFIRKFRLDELPQLFNIFLGDMSFVGARPEVPKYVDFYNEEMLATLLLPTGVTSRASIMYKDEAELLNKSKNTDETYIKEILPNKMKYNIDYMKKISFKEDIKIIFLTIKEVFF
ncbi:sugar transferase [Enterococcus innesii]|uniref:sugar transferase n=1 Tax=Enterococcus innesii TaxID=2839759 RepID=UPI0022B98973|nr:sugar transferase [Enterococcus innesii]